VLNHTEKRLDFIYEGEWAHGDLKHSLQGVTGT